MGSVSTAGASANWVSVEKTAHKATARTIVPAKENVLTTNVSAIKTLSTPTAAWSIAQTTALGTESAMTATVNVLQATTEMGANSKNARMTVPTTGSVLKENASATKIIQEWIVR